MSARGTAIRSALPPLLVAVSLAGAQGLWSAAVHSQTWDEAYAVAAGYRQVQLGDFGLVYENPPLLGLVVYPPLKLAGTRLPELRGPTPPPVYGARFLYASGNDHRRVLLLARMAVLAATLAAVGAVVVWAGRLYGRRGAWLAALLCAFEPNWLAHGHLAAWDGLGTATITLATLALAALVSRPSWARVMAAGGLVGLAWAAKHTALLLWPLWAVLALLCLPLAGRLRLGPVGREAPPTGRLLLQWAAVPVVGLLVVGACYNLTFRYDLYLESVRGIYRLTREGYESYLWGRFRQGGIPYYYLVALLVKTPLGFLPLAPLGLLAAGLKRTLRPLAPVLLSLALVLLATAFNRHNIGLRHALPAVPLLVLVAAGAAQAGWAGVRGRRWLPLAALALALVGVAETVARAPHYLSFFNLAAGGPAGGIRLLDESNIDWGQELPALARIQRDEGIDELALLYFGSADPSAYGVRWRPVTEAEWLDPQPGTVYAISVHALNRLPQRHGPRADWLRRYRPWRRAGYAIYLYEF